MRFEQKEDIQIDDLFRTIQVKINRIVFLVYSTQTILEKNVYHKAQTLLNISLILPWVQFYREGNFFNHDMKYSWTFV